MGYTLNVVHQDLSRGQSRSLNLPIIVYAFRERLSNINSLKPSKRDMEFLENITNQYEVNMALLESSKNFVISKGKAEELLTMLKEIKKLNDISLSEIIRLKMNLLRSSGKLRRKEIEITVSLCDKIISTLHEIRSKLSEVITKVEKVTVFSEVISILEEILMLYTNLFFDIIENLYVLINEINKELYGYSRIREKLRLSNDIRKIIKNLEPPYQLLTQKIVRILSN
ncbi:hypothetical protein KN1_09900 [Stygiolobus caldivivus]|uniref:Uncharacterized protein n=2 Tax=Stygiolobus caldivivus TaxID=2824673 RepID=A0A8D5U5I1_9CREN|nr:hypothetical protein KN1_09900 [Stygiolobus caldivivus]